MPQLLYAIIQESFDTIKSIGLTGALGIWGAFLSTGLGGIKLLELRRERLRLYTSRTLGHPDHGGNEIIIQNPSKIPALISHWKLVWRKKRLFRFKTTETLDFGLPEDRRDLIIAAHDTHTLTFTDEDYFEWGIRTAKKGKLYLELRIVGCGKPRMLKVYDPLR